MIISILNMKGGVAKTTTALNLAACARKDGHEVLCVDLDEQGDLTALLVNLEGVRVVQKLPVSFSGITIIDCAPFLDRTTKPALFASDLVLLPMQPSVLSYRATAKMFRDVPRLAPRAKMHGLITMYSHNYKADRDEIRADMGSELLETVIPRSKLIDDAHGQLENIFTHAPNSAPARAYRKLWREINEHHSNR